MLYEIFRWIALISAIPFELLFFRKKTYYEAGAPRRPWRQGGALIICNHFGFWDYFMSLFTVMPRKLHVVASEMPFQNSFLRFGMRFFGVLQANRITKNMRFIDEGAALIKQGKLLMIFPEGRNTDNGEIQPFHKSYLVIAHRAKAPIIPMITDGSYSLRRRTHIIVGKPIDLSQYITSTGRTPTREELERANTAIRAYMLALRDELNQRKQAS